MQSIVHTDCMDNAIASALLFALAIHRRIRVCVKSLNKLSMQINDSQLITQDFYRGDVYCVHEDSIFRFVVEWRMGILLINEILYSPSVAVV